jgi:hypothetical protein
LTQPTGPSRDRRHIPPAVQLSDDDSADDDYTLDPEEPKNLSTTVTNGLFGHYPLYSGTLADGTYAWRTQVSDTTDTSGWSATCYFHVDSTPPLAPTVSSPDYSTTGDNPGGIPGKFTFSPGASSDVVAYAYAWSPYAPTEVQAPRTGAPVTVTLVPPGQVNTLQVYSIDRAGNRSPTTTYRFTVMSTAPVVTPSTQTPDYGQPFTATISPGPHVTGVVSYTYTVNAGKATTVAAGPDGTATITVTFTSSGTNSLDVTSLSSNGWVSTVGEFSAYLDIAPVVTSDIYPDGVAAGGPGVTGTFTFTSRLPHTVSFTYDVDFGDPVTVPASPDGTATITWTPQASSGYLLEVVATGADGVATGSTYYIIDVA